MIMCVGRVRFAPSSSLQSSKYTLADYIVYSMHPMYSNVNGFRGKVAWKKAHCRWGNYVRGDSYSMIAGSTPKKCSHLLASVKTKLPKSHRFCKKCNIWDSLLLGIGGKQEIQSVQSNCERIGDCDSHAWSVALAVVKATKMVSEVVRWVECAFSSTVENHGILD